ncbi:receptor-like protein kinase FERONIA [Diospyros lotus]|uniref:receptor-like protein kinase FERONIA n=1 Tax=Diospyros lotus TaxID=55363 RepID=UPI00225BA024|nr:receptor-like protein kinase FERONIA [Diospyros lotus]
MTEALQTNLHFRFPPSSLQEMAPFPLYFSVLLHLILASTTAHAADPPAYSPTDSFFLDCGSSTSESYFDGRRWDGDSRSKFSPRNIDDVSLASTASTQDTSIPQIPFMTARIFNSTFTYTFPVSAGPKFVRFYFYPATYSSRDNSKYFFSVTAADYTLLSNFSAFLTVEASFPKISSLIKEFIVYVRDSQRLAITFVPSPNSYAFVNGIEVVSMPDNLYMSRDDHSTKFVGSQQVFTVDNKTALETLYRLNVGGNEVAGTHDTGMMYRTWVQDETYIDKAVLGFTPGQLVNHSVYYTDSTPAYTAPATVYSTARTMGNNPRANLKNNLTWFFTVDSGFSYLVRLHFCEIDPHVTLENQRIFTVFLFNQTADQEVDVIHRSGGNRFPVFNDYVVSVPNEYGQSRRNLCLALHPNTASKTEYADVILNGLEIFKLNGSNGNLAGPNPEPVLIDPTQQPQRPTSPVKGKSSGSPPVYVIVGAVLGGVFMASMLGFLIFRQRRRVEDSFETKAKSSRGIVSNASRSTKTNASSLPSDLCRHFSLVEIKEATKNFNEDFVIGSGGFGNVYKGFIHKEAITVAIKRLNPSSNQGAREFQTEIEMLSKLRHLHLVSLIGYCDDDGEMILVYDYVARGTLRDHLYNAKNPPLSWKQRLQICIGAARGLQYLHTGAKHTIIHRDVKSTNILLDEKWVAKVSDFGLSKMGPTDVSQTHVSTVVKGSFGYVDPEYYRRQQLTEKSDVYSYGVVLLEVLCARPAIVLGLPKEQVSLAEWARHCWRKGTVDQMLDPQLEGQIVPSCLRKYWEIVISCLRESGMERPAMSDVAWGLEFALQLQEGAEEKNVDLEGDWAVGIQSMITCSPAVSHWEGTDRCTASDGASSGPVFSDMMNPMGR